MFEKPKKEVVFKDGYDDEPVYYCHDCHSLKIKCDDAFEHDGWSGMYCDRCGSTDIQECTIQEWLRVEDLLHKFDEEE